MKARNIFLLVAVAFIAACSGSKTVVKDKNGNTLADKIIKKDTFEIESEWAMPLNATQINNLNLLPVGSNGGNINLQGNPNYFKKIGDSLSIDIPYYGEQQLGSSYGSRDIGVIYDGVPESSAYEYDEKKGAHIYKIDARAEHENYQIRVTIFPNLSTTISVNSSHRTTITYRGRVLE